MYYTYLIGWSIHNKWYYGVRYAKKSNPKELWVTYFTSSMYVKSFRKVHGEPDVVSVRKTFDDPQKARHYEHKVLKRLKVTKNDKWLNKTDNISFDPILMSEIGKTKTGKKNNFYGHKHTLQYKENQRLQKLRFYKDEKNKENISSSTKKSMSVFRSKFTDDEWKERYRLIGLKNKEKNKGQIPWNKGGILTEEHKLKISLSEKKTKSNYKGEV